MRVVSEPKPGLSFARKTAIESAEGRYLCFLDDDNDASDDYLEVAQHIFQTYPDVCFCGGQSSWPSTTRQEHLPLLARFFSKSVAIGPQRDCPDVKLGIGEFLWGAGLCLRASDSKALYAAGFLPLLTGRLGEQILSGEDSELTILLQMTGGRGFYSSSLRLEHRVNLDRLNLRYYSKLFYGMGMAFLILRAYRRVVQANYGETIIADARARKMSRVRRFSVLSGFEICTVVAMYGWLGLCFARGILRTMTSSVPNSATRQANRIALELNARSFLR